MAKSKLDEAALYDGPVYDSATKAQSSLDRIQEGIDRLLPKLKDAKNQDILLVLGNARVGKSTLVSYLSGTKLKVEKPQTSVYPILSLVNESTGAKIGHGFASHTKSQTKHIATKVANMQLWDVPGFNESSTREQDIINTYLIQELMTRAQSIRIVLVADFVNITADTAIKPFCEFLSTIATIFPDLGEVLDKFTIVVTKVDSEFTNADIAESLKNIGSPKESNSKLDNYYGSAEKRIKGETIIEHFVKNPDKIGVFVRPGKKDIGKDADDGVINPDNNISKTILRSGQVSSSQLENVKIGAHPDSITFVRENLKTIGEYYNTKVQSKVTEQIKLPLLRIKDAYTYRTYEKLLDIRSELVEIRKFVVEEKNSRKALESLCKMNGILPDEESRSWLETRKLISFNETIKHCTAMLKKAIGEPTLDDLLLVQLSLGLNTVSANLQIAQVRCLKGQGQLDKLTCDKLIEEAKKKGLTAQKELLDAEKEVFEKSPTIKQLGNALLKWTHMTAGLLGGTMGFFIMPYLEAKAEVKEAEGFLKTTGAVVKGVVYAIPRAVQGARDGSKKAQDLWEKHLPQGDYDYDQVGSLPFESSTPSHTDGASSSGKADIEEVEARASIGLESLGFIDFSIPKTDGASSSGTYNCILGMEYENEILNYPEVLKVLTDSLAISYSDVLDKVGGFDQEFVREACLSGNVELLEECFGN